MLEGFSAMVILVVSRCVGSGTEYANGVIRVVVLQRPCVDKLIGGDAPWVWLPKNFNFR